MFSDAARTFTVRGRSVRPDGAERCGQKSDLSDNSIDDFWRRRARD
jgi:hypothetical protein